MKILVACEFSGTVRESFNALGHTVYSCDLIPASIEGKHYIGNVLDILDKGWDLMIAHPPCTYLAASGMHWTTRGLRDPQLTENALQFVQKLMNAPIPKICIENPISIISSRIRKPDQIIQPWMFGDDASKKTCLWLKNLKPLHIQTITNVIPPKGYQTIISAANCQECDCCGEPYCPIHLLHYAECECIGPTNDEATYVTQYGILFGTLLKPAPKLRWDNQMMSGQNKLGESKNRARIRSKTYLGIAKAMAKQWG